MKGVSRKTSMLKSIIWRIMGVLVLGLVTYFFTRHWVVTGMITIVHHCLFLYVFYQHERIWSKIVHPTGRARNVIKSCIYELILGMGLGGLVVFVFTESFPMVTQITGTYTVIKLVMYFLYDRIWPEVK